MLLSTLLLVHGWLHAATFQHLHQRLMSRDVRDVAHHPNHEYIMIAHREGLPRGYTAGLYSYRMHRRFCMHRRFRYSFPKKPQKTIRLL
jgi:hypothetical protein